MYKVYDSLKWASVCPPGDDILLKKNMSVRQARNAQAKWAKDSTIQRL